MEEFSEARDAQSLLLTVSLVASGVPCASAVFRFLPGGVDNKLSPLLVFDSVGHGTWRGSHALNSPAKSWRRASRNSATIWGSALSTSPAIHRAFRSKKGLARGFRQCPSPFGQCISRRFL